MRNNARMHHPTNDEQRKLLRDFAWIFLALFGMTLATGGLLYLRGELRAALLVTGIIGPVLLACIAMQWVEIKQLEKRQ